MHIRGHFTSEIANKLQYYTLFVSGLPQSVYKDEHPWLLISSRQAAILSPNFSPVPQAYAFRLPSDVESFLGLSSPAVWCCRWLYQSSTVFLVPNYVRPCVSLTFRSSQYRKFAGRIYSGWPAGNLRTFFFGLFLLFLALWEPVRFTMSYRKHGFWVLIERCFKKTAMKYVSHLKFLPVVLLPPPPWLFLLIPFFITFEGVSSNVSICWRFSQQRMGERIKNQIWWRAAIWLGCVFIKSKSHGTYGRKPSFHCVMSATFTYYSGSFVPLRQNSTTLAEFDICWVESLATGQVIFKNLQAQGTFQSPRFLTESIRVRRSNSLFTHVTLTLAVERKTVKDLNSFNS